MSMVTLFRQTSYRVLQVESGSSNRTSCCFFTHENLLIYDATIITGIKIISPVYIAWEVSTQQNHLIIQYVKKKKKKTLPWLLESNLRIEPERVG